MCFAINDVYLEKNQKARIKKTGICMKFILRTPLERAKRCSINLKHETIFGCNDVKMKNKLMKEIREKRKREKRKKQKGEAETERIIQ